MRISTILKKINLRILRKMSTILPDEIYLKLRYRIEMGQKLNLSNPKKFTEKIQWLKLYNRRPEYTTMVDKFAVKDYVSNLIGSEFIIPTIGVYENVNEIDFSKLPNKFVLKTTNGGGSTGVVICKDKSNLDINAVKNKLNKSLKSDIYKYYREWPYKNVNKRIIAEQLLECTPKLQLSNYKLFFEEGELKLKQDSDGRSLKSPALRPIISIDKTKNINLLKEYLPSNLLEIIQKKVLGMAKQNPFIKVDLYKNPTINVKEKPKLKINNDDKFSNSTFENYEIAEVKCTEECIINFGNYIAIIYYVKTSNFLTDYKFFCFNGQPLYCQVISNRDLNECIDFYDENWIWQKGMVGLNLNAHNSSHPFPRPAQYDIMVNNAKIISKDIPFCRIDQYEIGDRVYFGEITFFPASGFGNWYPKGTDEKIGNLIKLPCNCF